MVTAPNLDTVDARLLNVLQRDFPLVRRPFSSIAAVLQISEEAVLERTARLKESGVLRQISMIFDSRALGYDSSLVASRVPDIAVARAVEAINAHPGVSHNYRREHDFNLWWTIAVPPGSVLSDHVDALHALSGAEVTRLMPTIRMFKIGVDFDMTGARESEQGERVAPARALDLPPLDAKDIALVRALQNDLPLDVEPFASGARAAGVNDEAFLESAKRFLEQGRARRFAAVLHHRHAGFTANGMSVWRVPEERIEECGEIMSGFAAVSHCYQRPTYPDWHYNLFGMLHARSREECERTAEAIADAIAVADHTLLFSTKEYKKVRVRYFEDDVAAWEHTHLADARSSASPSA